MKITVDKGRKKMSMPPIKREGDEGTMKVIKNKMDALAMNRRKSQFIEQPIPSSCVSYSNDADKSKSSNSSASQISETDNGNPDYLSFRTTKVSSEK